MFVAFYAIFVFSNKLLLAEVASTLLKRGIRLCLRTYDSFRYGAEYILLHCLHHSFISS